MFIDKEATYKIQGAHAEQKIIAIDCLSLLPLTLVTSLGGDETNKFRDTFLRSKEWDRHYGGMKKGTVR